MKLGILTSIFDGWSFEEVLDIAQNMGFECLEVACWPKGKAERRYAGVSHIDVERMTEEDAARILEMCRSRKIEISSLAFYPNTLDPNLEKRRNNIEHLMKVIDASARLRVNMVTTFIGRDQNKSVEENLKIVSEVWPPIIKHAEEKEYELPLKTVRCCSAKTNGQEGRT